MPSRQNSSFLFRRFIDLTDEAKAKIEGSQKVAKKLNRLKKQEEGGSPSHDQSENDTDNDSDTINEQSADNDDFVEFPSMSSTQSHDNYTSNNGQLFSPDSLLSSRSCCSCACHIGHGRDITTADAFCQTLSTGDIVITKVVFDETN